MDERIRKYIKAKHKKLEDLEKIENAIKSLSGKGPEKECHIELSLLFVQPINGSTHTRKKEIPDRIKYRLLDILELEKKGIEDELKTE